MLKEAFLDCKWMVWILPVILYIMYSASSPLQCSVHPFRVKWYCTYCCVRVQCCRQGQCIQDIVLVTDKTYAVHLQMYIHKRSEKLAWWRLCAHKTPTNWSISSPERKRQFLVKTLKFSVRFMGSLRSFLFQCTFMNSKVKSCRLN